MQSTGDDEQTVKVTPWEVSGKIDYLKLVNEFGTELITQELQEKFRKVTGKDLHPWIKRGIFFSHRGLNQFLDAYANGEPVFLYTGRGPTSDAMHVGHLIPFMFTKWLQDVFDCPLVIQIADDEKAAFKRIDFKEIYKMGFENAKEIISCGFNKEKTFIFSNRDYRLNCKPFENFVSDMKNQISAKEVSKIFGFEDNPMATVNMYDWPFYQSAAAFSQAFPHIFKGRPAYCLVPYAIDQDPYFRMARDLANKMKLLKPCSIISTFIPPLTGNQGKMSSSVGVDSTLFLNDSEDVLKSKIRKHCYSGGGGTGTMEDHKKFGGNIDIDVAYQYLRYFEYDDARLARIKKDFESGQLSCGGIKELLIEKLVPLILSVQERRSTVDDSLRDEFYKWNEISLPQPKKKDTLPNEKALYDLLDQLEINYRVKYHSPITTMEEGEEIAKTLEGDVCKNLFLKGSKDSYYLYICNSSTNVNLKALPKKLGISKINFAEKDTLEYLLKVPKGAVNPFAIINDSEKKINIIIDDSIQSDMMLNFHPMRNDATITISYWDLIKFFKYLSYSPITLSSTN